MEAIILAQTLALGGVLLGIMASALGVGPHTPANAIFHHLIVRLLACGLVLVFSPKVSKEINQMNNIS